MRPRCHDGRVSQPPASLTLPGRGDLALLAIAVAAVSTSAPIIAATMAPALGIAMWRCALGSAATGSWLLVRRPWSADGRVRRWPRNGPEWTAALGGGTLLALHFATWIPSLRFTSVASATALVATQPVWAALLARARGTQIAARVWWGIAVALSGVLLLTGIDFALDPRSLIGDGLALVGGMLAAAYVSAGEAARRNLPTSVYAFLGYGWAALVLVLISAVMSVPLAGYTGRDWGLIVLLTATAQLLGHSLINQVLGSVSATVTSLAILFEFPGAVLIAAVWLRQVPPATLVPALLLLMLGLAIVIRSSGSAEPVEDPPV